MKFNITREISDSKLIHADEGKKRKKHKYIARVPIKNSKNSKKNKYRYFYDMEEYQAYLKSKKDKAINDTKNKFEDTKSSVTNFFKNVEKTAGSINDSLMEKSKKFVKSVSNKKVVTVESSHSSNNKLKDAVTFLLGGLVGYTVKELLKNFTKNKNVDTEDGSEDEPVDHKYIAKVALSNGKYRYFYEQEEYDAYLERLDYQQNEPDFMKNVKDLSGDDIFTANEDMSKVNELYDPYDDATSTNCAYCSAAYELRRRGYDVEAKLRDDDYVNNCRGDRFYDWFENAELIAINSDGSTITHTEEYVRKVWDGKANFIDDIKHRDECKYYTTEQYFRADALEKGIKAHNPPGSRGMIDVDWRGGSAHSIIYEVNNDGKVIIRDSQTYDEYSLDELAGRVSRVRICRTDNLKLKNSSILNAVKTNEDKERTYYLDDGRVHVYDE